jgi:hypothetical protein
MKDTDLFEAVLVPVPVEAASCETAAVACTEASGPQQKKRSHKRKHAAMADGAIGASEGPEKKVFLDNLAEAIDSALRGVDKAHVRSSCVSTAIRMGLDLALLGKVQVQRPNESIAQDQAKVHKALDKLRNELAALTPDKVKEQAALQLKIKKLQDTPVTETKARTNEIGAKY